MRSPVPEENRIIWLVEQSHFWPGGTGLVSHAPHSITGMRVTGGRQRHDD